MIGREALLLGLTAGIPGALLGVPLASAIHAEFVSLGAVPGTLQLAHSPFPILAAAVATAGVSWVATRVTARRIARIRPAQALAEATIERPTAGFGRLLAAGNPRRRDPDPSPFGRGLLPRPRLRRHPAGL
jgi:putative ABC transport system permease protein